MNVPTAAPVPAQSGPMTRIARPPVATSVVTAIALPTTAPMTPPVLAVFGVFVPADVEIASDWLLRGCAMVEHQGRRLPAIGRITLLSRVGHGGMGVVYRGLNPRLNTEVAVKVLPPSLDQSRTEFAERFVRE